MTTDTRPVPWPWKASTSVKVLLGMPFRIIAKEDNLMAFVGDETVLIIVDEQSRIVEILHKDTSDAKE